MVESYREMARKDDDIVLLLDAGDIFQGTPYFNFFGGEVEFKLMSKLKYDATTIGNHDFDNGIERDPGYVYGPMNPRTVYFGLKIGNFVK